MSDPLHFHHGLLDRGGSLIAAVALLAMAASGCGRSGPPNVILISLDTVRADHLSVYGYDAPTSPTLEKLGARGTVFENAFTQAPNTAPSHTTMLTGLYPSVHRVWSHGMSPDPSIPVLPELFAAAGYQTVAFVQLEGTFYGRGFEEYTRTGRWGHDPDVEGGLYDWLEASGNEPFFMFLHTYEAHAPYAPEDSFRRQFARPYEGPLRHDMVRHEDLQRFNEGELEITEDDVFHIKALYDAEIAFIDSRLGLLFDKLDELGIIDDTIILVMADHGDEFNERGQVGRHSYTIYNELTRVPLLIAGPGVPAGVRVETAVGIIDILPTLTGLVGIEPPRVQQGFDLAPLWGDDPEATRLPVVTERPGVQAIMGRNLKLFSDGRMYDLIADPGETRNILLEKPGDAVYLQGRLDRWTAEVSRLRDTIAPSIGEHLSREARDRLRALGYVQ